MIRVKANILATSDLNLLGVWLKLWTMTLCHVLPAIIDNYKVTLVFFYVELLK